MKQAIIILLVSIYTTFNIGLVVNTHYCGGKVASVSIYKTQENGCTLCGKKKMSKDCCKDTQTQFTMADTQDSPQINSGFSHFSFAFTLIPFAGFIPASTFSIINQQSIKLYSLDTGPPKTPIYIQIQSLII